MWKDSVRGAADILSAGDGVLKFCKTEGQAYKRCKQADAQADCAEEIDQIQRCSWNYASGFLIELAGKNRQVQRNCEMQLNDFNQCVDRQEAGSAGREGGPAGSGASGAVGGNPKSCQPETMEILQCSANWFIPNHHMLEGKY